MVDQLLYGFKINVQFLNNGNTLKLGDSCKYSRYKNSNYSVYCQKLESLREHKIFNMKNKFEVCKLLKCNHHMNNLDIYPKEIKMSSSANIHLVSFMALFDNS